MEFKGISHFWTLDGAFADMHAADISAENVASNLTDNKKTWKAYFENLPKPGSLTASREIKAF